MRALWGDWESLDSIGIAHYLRCILKAWSIGFFEAGIPGFFHTGFRLPLQIPKLFYFRTLFGASPRGIET